MRIHKAIPEHQVCCQLAVAEAHPLGAMVYSPAVAAGVPYLACSAEEAVAPLQVLLGVLLTVQLGVLLTVELEEVQLMVPLAHEGPWEQQGLLVPLVLKGSALFGCPLCQVWVAV